MSSSVYDAGVVTVEDTLERRDTRGLKRATTFHLDDYFYFPVGPIAAASTFPCMLFLGRSPLTFLMLSEKPLETINRKHFMTDSLSSID